MIEAEIRPIRIPLRYPQEKGLVLYLPFDRIGEKTAFDLSPYRNNGTIYGAVWVHGKFGQALSFDGVDDYVEVPIFSLTDKFTIEAWAYRIDGQPSGDYAGIISNLNGKNNYNRLLIRNTTVLFQLSIGGTIYNHSKTDLPPLSNAWHHYVATYDGSTVKLFVDGSLVYSGTQTGNLDSGSVKPTIGWGSVLPAYYHFKGLIDEVRIYNRALSKEEIKEHYYRLHRKFHQVSS
jgi:hypothetical protein